MSAGSVPTNATEIYQEGLRIPPLKLREAGVYNDTLVALIRQNVRIPDTVMGDLNAQIAACTIGARRFAELAERFGDNQLAAICAELLARSETLTRAALARIPPGTYRYVDWLDNDGIELDRPIRIEVAATVGNGAIEFDFAGTSPQVKGPLNCVPSGSLAAACWAVRALTDPEIPTNGGCFRPITLKLPHGHHRQSAGAGAGQRAHLDDQAHRRLHGRRAGAGAAWQGAGRLGGRAACARLRRQGARRRQLRRRRTDRRRQRRRPRLPMEST